MRGSATETLPRDQPGDERNPRADKIWERGVRLKKSDGKQRPDNPREAAGALRDADGRALLVRWREDREQSKQRWSRKSGTNRQQRERGEQLPPVPAGVAEENAPR